MFWLFTHSEEQLLEEVDSFVNYKGSYMAVISHMDKSTGKFGEQK